jgi:type I site-specific restriction endonuclease
VTTPEAEARQTIDQLLTAAGWAVQDVKQADRRIRS